MILSLRDSDSESANVGCFTECQFHKDDIITVYLGSKCHKNMNTTSEYKLGISPSHNIDPVPGDKHLLLGGHKANDANWVSETGVEPKGTKVKLGRKMSNNAEYQGIHVVSTQRILVVKEILVDYNYSSD